MTASATMHVMKSGVILLSLLAAAGAWWWITRGPGANGRRQASRWVNGLVKGAAIGIGVYIVLTLGALLYLAITASS